jgi:hypothetical protein
MKAASQSKASTLGVGKRITGLGAAALFVSTLTVMAAKPAAAFDIGGLIGTAMMLQMGGHYGSYHHSRERVASQHERDSSGRNSSGGERDARDVDVTPQNPKAENKIAARHQSFGPNGSTTQASERDASAGDVATSEMTSGDAPAFSPSR